MASLGAKPPRHGNAGQLNHPADGGQGICHGVRDHWRAAVADAARGAEGLRFRVVLAFRALTAMRTRVRRLPRAGGAVLVRERTGRELLAVLLLVVGDVVRGRSFTTLGLSSRNRRGFRLRGSARDACLGVSHARHFFALACVRCIELRHSTREARRQRSRRSLSYAQRPAFSKDEQGGSYMDEARVRNYREPAT